VRRIPAFVAVTVLLGAGLVGCSSSAPSSCATPPTDSGLAAAVSATGAVGSVPDASLRSPFLPSEASSLTLVQGSGPQITDPEQLVFVDVTVFNAKTGKNLGSTGYTSDVTQAPTVRSIGTNITVFPKLLECATEGSRVAVALPYDDLGPQIAGSFGLSDGDAAVFLVDVRKVFPWAADGADQFNVGGGLPTVVRAPGGQPGVIVPDSAAPTELRTQVIEKGDGQTLTADSVPVLQILGVGWADKRKFTSTWDQSGPAPTKFSSLPADFQTALKDQPVGSQILIVVPATDAASQQQPSGAPKDSALIYVVDIVGTIG